MPRQQCIVVKPFTGFHLIEKGRKFGIKSLLVSWPANIFFTRFCAF
jgi:hypothetical protein